MSAQLGVETDHETDQAEAPRSARRGTWLVAVARRAGALSEAGLLGGLVVLVLIFATWQPDRFATLSNVKNLAADSSILLILALSTTFVVVSGQFDLSIGGVIAVTEVVTATSFRSFGGMGSGAGAILAGLAIALATGALCGVINGALVTRLRLAPFVATLATLSVAQGAAYVIGDGADLATTPSWLSAHIGIGTLGPLPWIVWIAIALAAAAAYVLHRTRFGRHTYALGSDRQAAERAGIRTGRHIRRVNVLAGLTYGLVAFLNLARFSTTNVGGHNADALNAITAVALGGGSLFGGLRTILGTILGVFIPSVLQNGLVIAAVSPFYAEIGTGIALVIALYIDRVRRSRADGA